MVELRMPVFQTSRTPPLFRKCVQHRADFREFFFCSRLGRKSSHHEASGRPVEGALQQVGSNLALGLLIRNTSFINMCTVALGSDQQALFGHQLHLFERGGIAAVLGESVVELAGGGRSEAPKDGEDIDFSGGGQRQRRSFGHLWSRYNDFIRKSTTKIVDPLDTLQEHGGALLYCWFEIVVECTEPRGFLL